MSKLKDDIRILLADGKIVDAFDTLEKYWQQKRQVLKSCSLNRISSLRQRYLDNNKNFYHLGILSYGEYTIEKNIISHELLKLTDQDSLFSLICFVKKPMLYIPLIITTLLIFYFGTFISRKAQSISPSSTSLSYHLLKKNNEESINDSIHLYDQAISIEYMRLFNVEGVPYLMNFIENPNIVKEYEISKPIDIHSPLFYSEEFKNFWSSEWYFKNAKPLMVPLWKNDISFESALDPTAEDYYSYFRMQRPTESIMDYFEPSDLLTFGKPLDSIEGRGHSPEDIGYLFLLMKNTTNTNFNEMSIIYRNYKNPWPETGYFKLDKEGYEWPCNTIDFNNNGEIDCIEEYLGFINRPDIRKKALKPGHLEKCLSQSLDTIRVANVRPGDTFIWLVSVYRCDPDQLVELYLTDVIVPLSFEIITDRGTFSQPIRQPYGKGAARLFIPQGWAGQ